MRKLNVGSDAGRMVSHELTEALITIGRAPDNLIQLDDPSVSGRHAQLQLVGEDYHLKDLESTNGTRVNGNAITTTMLRAGDRIRFGKVEASFECETAGSAQPLPVQAAVQASPAEISARPADFANASPFARRKMQRDPVRTAIFGAVAVAILAFVGSMVALLQMQPPMP
jgi:pSer/pThr/pTyr-binding forkhead associated (FHA) protein